MPVHTVSGLIQNLSDRLLGQLQPSQNNVVQKELASPVTPSLAEDTFTPSPQNSAGAPAQDAGLFQFAPGTLTANQNNATTPTKHGAIPLLAPAPGSSATKTAANGAATQFEGNAPANQDTNSPLSAVDLQLEIQSLNAALPALGLTNTEINQIDRIATLVQNFNPAAYANLVSQFEALAQNAGSPTNVNALLLSNTTAPPAAGNSTHGSGYRIRNVSLQFTGSTQPGNSSFAGGGGKNADATSAQTNSAGMQIAKVQFTLINGNGQTVQIQTP